MPQLTDLHEYRQKIFTALKQAGYPVDAWKVEYEAELATNPTARARPFTVLKPPKYGKIRKLRPGFEEFIAHPAHSKPVPRCQAAKKRTNGKVQCSKFAVKGMHLCRTHGGGAGSGRLSEQGRQNQIASVTVHGGKTAAKKRARRVASQELKSLEKQARETGIITAVGSRGPYWKLSRIGAPMGHLRRINKL
jgi:hypothetical protein